MDYHALQHDQSYQNQTNAHEKNSKLAQKYEKYMLSRQSMFTPRHIPPNLN